MPPDAIDFASRSTHLREHLDEPMSREVLERCLRDLRRINRLLRGYRPVLDWLDTNFAVPGGRPLHILDVGSGYGDVLRRIDRWARRRGIAVELTGVDLNAETVAIAAGATGRESIEWVQADVFAYQPGRPVHLIISSLFTHHLTQAEIVRFLGWMEQRAELGWLINDLSRSPVPYHLYRLFSRAVGLHPYVRHDGAVSIARSFVREDWLAMCAAAGLAPSDVSIRGYTPGRLAVARRKTP